MKRDVEQARTFATELQDFSWFPMNLISWKTRDKHGIERLTLMSEVLPSTEAVMLLVTQCEKCNAMATKVWLESPYGGTQTVTQEIEKPTLSQWRTLCHQLESELHKAKRQAQELEADTNKLFADIEHSLSMSTPPIKESDLERFRGRCAQYSGLLGEVIDSLKQAELAASEVRNWESNSLPISQD